MCDVVLQPHGKHTRYVAAYPGRVEGMGTEAGPSRKPQSWELDCEADTRQEGNGEEKEMTSVPQTRPPDNFVMWCSPHRSGINTPQAKDYELVEAWRREWGEVRVIDPLAMLPQNNVAGLYWRPVGGWNGKRRKLGSTA